MHKVTSRSRNIVEAVVPKWMWLCAMISILTTVFIVGILLKDAIVFFSSVSVVEFLTNPLWTPLFDPQNWGIRPLVYGTLTVAVGAALISIPLGLGSALYLSEYASERARRIIKPILEIVAGIPTIVYGYFALEFITPALKTIIPDIEVFNALSASIAVGIMITPMIASLSEEALLAVPQSVRHGAYALGSTKLETSIHVVIPYALSGIVASIVLAISRALGETMIVTVAAGATPKLGVHPLESIQTMTAYIVQISMGDTPAGSVEYLSIFAVGITLFIFTAAMNLLARYITKRFKIGE
jgi:phosphate transport system permease protein